MHGSLQHLYPRRCQRERESGSTHLPLDGGWNGKSTLLPQRFTMTVETSELACRLNGNGVSCNGEGTMINGTYTSEVTGTLSGLTMAGTLAVHGYSPGFCTSQSEASGPIAYDFSPDGTVAVRQVAAGRSCVQRWVLGFSALVKHITVMEWHRNLVTDEVGSESGRFPNVHRGCAEPPIWVGTIRPSLV